MRTIQKLLAAALTFALSVSLFAVASMAAGKNVMTLSSVREKSPTAYERIPVSVAGRSIDEPARLIGGVTYVTLRSFVTAAGDASVGYDPKTRTASVHMRGLELSVSDGAYAMFANGRVLFSTSPAVILADGKTYVPVRPLCKALGMTLTWNAKTRAVSVTGAVTPLRSAAEYYDADTVYWLSRIISAEAGGEPLLGQIAVGEVVLNRVLSRDFPATVYGVIFDRKNGIQFSPVANGTVYRAPTDSAILAAKICLEGRVLSDRALFFLAPEKSVSFWIPRTREYLFSVGAHDFYA